MNWQAVQIGVMEIVLCGIIGLMTVYGSFLLFNRLTPDIDEEREIQKDNRAVAVAMGGNLLGIALIMKESLYPIAAVVQDFADQPLAFQEILTVMGYSGLYLFITAAASLATVLLTMHCFTRMTRNLEEQNEIAKGNLAAAIFYSSVVIAIAFFVAEGAGSLTRALIPSPSIEITNEASTPIFPQNPAVQRTSDETW